MSDEEEVLYVKKIKTIHYGSLEDGEKARASALEEVSNDNGGSSDVIPSAPQIHISNGKKITFIFKTNTIPKLIILETNLIIIENSIVH